MPTRKIIVFFGLTTAIFVSSVNFWQTATEIFFDPFNIRLLVVALLYLTFYLTSLSLSSLLIKRGYHFLFISLFVSLPSLFTTYALNIGPFIPLAAYLLTTLGSQAYFLKLKNDQNLFVRPSLAYLIHSNFGLIFTLISFILSLSYYAYSVQNLDRTTIVVPETVLDNTVQLSLNLLGPSAMVSNLPPEMLKTVVLNPIKEGLRSQINNLLLEYRSYIAPILATSFFLTLATLGSPIRAVTTLLSFLLLKLLTLLKVVVIVKETKEVETYTLGD